MNKKDIPEGVVCERCGKSAPIDEERSNKNWIVYKTDKPCECGGKYILRVLYKKRKTGDFYDYCSSYCRI